MLLNNFLLLTLNILICSCYESEYSLRFQNFLNYIGDILSPIITPGSEFDQIDNSTIGFLLVTENFNMTYINIDNLHNLSIKENKPFKVLIHGLRDRYYYAYYANTTREYMKKNNINMILVDWGDIANTSNAEGPRCSLGVGITIGNFIIELNSILGVPYEDFHLIGFSLGSHVAGFAGKHVKNMTGYSVGRISAADPSARMFNNAPAHLRLDKTDALFVDVIHTDRTILGINYVAGHADFYPSNGKAAQPHCYGIFSFVTRYFSKCNHVMAPRYYIESVNSYDFVATKCDEVYILDFFKLSKFTSYLLGYCNENPTAIMGENCNTSARGQYFLDVNSQPLYAKGA